MRLGLIVNPIAGMGGRLAFKGSDDAALVAAARERGASPSAPARATEALRPLAALGGGLEVLAYAGEMGEQAAADARLATTVLGRTGPSTSAQDTRAAAVAMADRNVDLLLFAGGDGTAVDVLEAIGDRIPVLGIPAGVKMHSAVFAVNPRSAGELAARLARDGMRSLRRAEVMDVDEALLRAGAVSARLHGFMNVPDARRHLQNAKARSLGSEALAQEEIAHHLIDNVLGDGTWLIGPGTTTGLIMALLGLEKTLLGVDVVRAGMLPDRRRRRGRADRAARGAGRRHRRGAGRRTGVPVRPRQPAAVRRGDRTGRPRAHRGRGHRGEDRAPRLELRFASTPAIRPWTRALPATPVSPSATTAKSYIRSPDEWP